MTAFHPVCIILTGLGSRGLSRRPGIVRPGKGIRIAVHCRLHQKPHLSGSYCFQHLLHRQLLHQGNKIGVTGIGGGIDHILNAVAAMPMTAEHLTIDLGHAGTLIAVARRNTILDRRSSNGELENRANAVCVQRTVYKRGTF